MGLVWRISPEIKGQIRHLPPDLKRRVWDSIETIFRNPHTGKALSEELAGFRSYRLGKYRLIYRVTKERLVLEALGPRSDIYERFVLEIGRQKIRERSAKFSTKPRKR